MWYVVPLGTISKLPCAFYFFSHLHLKMFFKMFLTSLMNGPFSTQLDKQCTFVMSSTRGALLAKVKKSAQKCANQIPMRVSVYDFNSTFFTMGQTAGTEEGWGPPNISQWPFLYDFVQKKHEAFFLSKSVKSNQIASIYNSINRSCWKNMGKI